MRIKRGTTKKQRHSKVLKQTKGFRMTYSKLYRRAKEALLHAGQYSFTDRRHRRSQMRNEWIKAISAGLIESGISYSQFVGNMKKNNIEIDRKNLAYLAMNKPELFKQVVDQAK